MKYTYLLMAASVGFLASCSQIEQDFSDTSRLSDGDLVERIIFEVLPVKDGDAPETRASAVPDGGTVGFVWEATDTVGIYPDKGSQVYFNVDDGVGTSSVSFDGGGWALKQNSTYTSYYPFVGDIYLKRDKIPVTFAGQKQIGTTAPFVGARYYLATEASTSENGVLRFSYSTLNTIINVNATLPAGTYTQASLTIEEPLFVEEGTYSLDEREIVGTKFTNTLEIELEDVVLTEEMTIPIYIMSAPVDLKGKVITVRITAADGWRYECTKTPSKAYVAGTRYGLTCSSMEKVLGDEDEYPVASGVSLNRSSIVLTVGDAETLVATVTPVGAYPSVVWSSSDDAIATVSANGVVTAVAKGNATIIATTVSGGHTAECNVSVSIPTKTINGHSYVDIGIRKSYIDRRITPGSEYDRKIVFATCNIGADCPEDFGYYFRWGELNGWEINTEASSSAYLNILSAVQYDKDGNALSSSWDGDTFYDSYALAGREDLEGFKGKTDLQCNGITYGDAATHNWGSVWVTPDQALFNAFFLSTNWAGQTGRFEFNDGSRNISIGNSNGSVSLKISYVEQNGVNGLLIENPSLGQSVFIPASGMCFGSNWVFDSDGTIWSSSIGETSAIWVGQPVSLVFDSSEVRLGEFHAGSARSIRPVAELTLDDEIPTPIVLPSVELPEIQSIE